MNIKKKKVLLLLLPFWTPLIPPVGIASLKANNKYKEKYDIKVVDANVDGQFSKIREKFYLIIKKTIPKDHLGNYYNISNELIANLLIMYSYIGNKPKAIEYIQEYVYKAFFYTVNNDETYEYMKIIEKSMTYLDEYICRMVIEENPDYIGLSMFKGNLGLSIRSLQIFNNKYPNIKIMVGGGIFANDLSINSTNFQNFIALNRMNKIMIGEGELLFNKVLDEIETDKQVYILSDLDEQFDINCAISPDYSDYHLESYPYIGIYGSRSCPYQCSFCSETLNWGKYRFKQNDKIVNEMLYLSAKYTKKLFLFCDSLLNPIIDGLSVTLSEKNLNLYFDGYLRADKNATITERVAFWKESGFYRARLGLESGSQRILDAMSKNITIDQMKKVLKTLANSGIKTTTYWIIGYPSETEEDFVNTLDFLTEMKDYIYEAECNTFTYYETGQTLSNEYKKSGVITNIIDITENEVPFINWQTNIEPNRKCVHERVVRFCSHCDDLKIPNPYTIFELIKADKRWVSLHSNAVPAILDLI